MSVSPSSPTPSYINRAIKSFERFYIKYLFSYDFYIFLGISTLLALKHYWFWSGLTMIILYPVSRVWIMRDNLMMSLRSIEIQIFGKPLDKEYWKKGEKVKTRWHK